MTEASETIAPAETTPTETTLAESTPGFHPYETYTETQTITIEQIQPLIYDQIHADLFGSFLVCGTIVGIALLWRFR